MDRRHAAQELNIVVKTCACNEIASRNEPSVSGGIHGSTEYGKLSTRAQSPRIEECNSRRDAGYSAAFRLGSLIRRT